MLQDTQGLEVTTDSPETIAAINRYTDQALAYGNDALVILKGISADPTCAIANAHAAALYLSHECAESRRKAASYLEVAKTYKAKATERERLFISAVETWAKGDIDRSIAYTEAIAEKFPRDIVAVQLGQYHYFYQGNKEGLLQIAEKVLPANRENHYLHGMIAFGLEQCHRLSEAEAMGRLATQLNRNDPWAHHAVAHVMEMQGRIEEGIAWMESLSDTWENCNSMLYTHNWWHIALYYLEKLDIPKVLALYDAHVWGRACKESPKDQIGAIQVLLRLELRGVDVGDFLPYPSLRQRLCRTGTPTGNGNGYALPGTLVRTYSANAERDKSAASAPCWTTSRVANANTSRWEKLAAYLTPRIHEHALPFQDLHYVYALSRAGKDELVNEMLLSMQEYAKTVKPDIQQRWTEVVLPAAKGMVAHARGEWERATQQLQPTLPRLYKVGGSHAQRDLFEQVYLDAWLRAEHNREALYLLEKRVSARRYVPSLTE